MDVLIISGYYLPGFKGGGPIRTVANMIESIGEGINFSLITSDRDLGDLKPYNSIIVDSWQRVGLANVFYLSPSRFSVFRLLKLCLASNASILHLNSFFSPRFSIFPLLFWLIFRFERNVVVGPRGEFSSGALAIKSIKKKIFLQIFKFFGLHRFVIWHASTDHEARDIFRVMGSEVSVRTAIDISLPEKNLVLSHRADKFPFRIVFVSRISPMKNLLYAINVVKCVRLPVIFDIYGPVEDCEYWCLCKDLILNAPDNVVINYCGVLPYEEVALTMSRYDLFFMPSLGENYGHVIAEAFSSGLPVLTSDKTPWRDLVSTNLGWDISLDDSTKFVDCIEYCCDLSVEDYFAWRCRVRDWSIGNARCQESVDQNRALFENLRI